MGDLYYNKKNKSKHQISIFSFFYLEKIDLSPYTNKIIAKLVFAWSSVHYWILDFLVTWMPYPVELHHILNYSFKWVILLWSFLSGLWYYSPSWCQKTVIVEFQISKNQHYLKSSLQWLLGKKNTTKIKT